MGQRLPFSGELEFAHGTKIHAKRIARFRELMGEYTAKAAIEAFWDGAVDNITLGEMSRYTVNPPYTRPHPAETYTPNEWLGVDDDEVGQ